MRKLASIQKIRDIQPIKGADKIELATINNWKVVVAKDVGHKIGDTVVYFEIDSFLPIEPEFEFLRKTSFKRMGEKEGFRLRTIKLRGQFSQGLIVPLNDAEKISKRFGNDINFNFLEIGEDVTEILNVEKYEPPIPANLAGKVKGGFPSFLRKTDEPRIQNLTENYEDFKTKKWYVAEKLDGSSSTFYFRDNEFGVCSRNLELQRPEDVNENTFWKVADQLNLEDKLKSVGMNISIQGELIGEGIQKNPYNIKGQTVRFFNAFDIDKCEYLSFEDFKSLMKSLDLEMVPILEENFTLPETIDELISMADGKSVLNEKAIREGFVIRTHDRKESFKVISNHFLI